MTSDPEPALVADTILRLDDNAVGRLDAYWLAVSGHRDSYATRLESLLQHLGMPVLIVRQTGFDNPNALMSDLVRLFECNRSRLLATLSQVRHRVSVVLLAHNELTLSQNSSAVVLPDWVPVVGGRSELCHITDITRAIDVPLNADAVGVSRLGSALLAVEEALIRCLRHVHEQSPHLHHDLFQQIGTSKDPDWQAVLSGAERAVNGVNGDGFRPKSWDGATLVSRLWGLSQKHTSGEVAKRARALAKALDLPDDYAPEDRWLSLQTVLARLLKDTTDGSDRFCRNLILTVGAACQYLTCAAHAGEYQSYPVNLLRSVVDDVHRSLTVIENSLNHSLGSRVGVGGTEQR
ncbi:hypothetical protein [Kutzneria sp. NPDC052558]|uniref:hypothetical protein n=1 Tax=Kutzneria sp. NPDC052558 TaxID=3364121 RepID=UPI0037C6E47D